MSKASELRVLRYGRSVDAPINYHHRTGDGEDVAACEIDFYAQTESAEEIFLQEEDEQAREKFVKGFKKYLKFVYTAKEREFLARVLSGKESPYKIGKSLGVEHFEFMQRLQKKAYKSAKQLVRLALKTGWSKAEAFTETIFQRLEQLRAGFALNDVLPLTKYQKDLMCSRKWAREHREKARENVRRWRAANPERARELDRRYNDRHREEKRERDRRYAREHREKRGEQYKRWREANPEKARESVRQWRAENPEKARESVRRWHKANPEKARESVRRCAARKKAERLAAQSGGEE